MGNHSFRYFCFYTAYPARKFTLSGHDEHRKSEKKKSLAKVSIQDLTEGGEYERKRLQSRRTGGYE